MRAADCCTECGGSLPVRQSGRGRHREICDRCKPIRLARLKREQAVEGRRRPEPVAEPTVRQLGAAADTILLLHTSRIADDRQAREIARRDAIAALERGEDVRRAHLALAACHIADAGPG